MHVYISRNIHTYIHTPTAVFSATGVHDASSRSHAVLKIYVQRHDLARRRREAAAASSSSEGPALIEGTLTLVDLAGSEHRIDSMYVCMRVCMYVCLCDGFAWT